MKFLIFTSNTFKIHFEHNRSLVFSCSICMIVPLMRISGRKSETQVKIKFTIVSIWKESISSIVTAPFTTEVWCLLTH